MSNARSIAPSLALGVAIAVGGGCGPEAPDAVLHLRLTTPFPDSLTTQEVCDPTFDGPRLLAELRVGGHLEQECPLDVSTADRSVSGQCDGITVGIVRPLALVWLQAPPDTAPDPAPAPAPLAYFVTSIDLEIEQLESGQTEAVIEFTSNGETGQVFTEQAVLEAVASPAPDGATALEAAEAWLVEAGRKQDPSLDGDNDACRNLTEACDGNLFDATHLSPCP